MDRTPVTSSNLSSVGYDPNSKTLEVEFNNGTVYQYFDVPQSVHTGLMSAGSHGEYFNDHVKKGGYRYRKAS